MVLLCGMVLYLGTVTILVYNQIYMTIIFILLVIFTNPYFCVFKIVWTNPLAKHNGILKMLCKGILYQDYVGLNWGPFRRLFLVLGHLHTYQNCHICFCQAVICFRTNYMYMTKHESCRFSIRVLRIWLQYCTEFVTTVKYTDSLWVWSLYVQWYLYNELRYRKWSWFNYRRITFHCKILRNTFMLTERNAWEARTHFVHIITFYLFFFFLNQ